MYENTTEEKEQGQNVDETTEEKKMYENAIKSKKVNTSTKKDENQYEN